MTDANPWVPNFRARNGKVHQKQVDIFNCNAKYLLVCGGRRTGKSIAVESKVLRHLWETPGARVALVTKTNKVGKEGGVWSDLIEMIMPEWLNSNMIGMTGLPLEYTSESRGMPGPRVDGATRTSSFRIRNYYGGESELIHLSLDDANEVEAKFKGTRYSMIWFSELSEFASRNVFTQTIQSLRIGDGTPYEKNQQFIADTNPAVEGEDSWIYQLWYVERNRKDHPEPLFQQDLQLIEVLLQDNPFLTEKNMAELRGSNVEMNEGDYKRNVLGQWSKGFGHRGKLFSDLIVPSLHFIGPAIDVSSDTLELFGGWDIGQVNNAFAIIEKRIIQNLVHWCIIDEVVTIDEKIGTADFAVMCWEKMLKLEEHYDRTFEWTHWSDDSALNFFRASSEDGYDAAIVRRVTAGTVELMGADKGKDSVSTGIKMIRRALRENRIFIGDNCPKTQEMLMEISEGKLRPVDDSQHKHPFDAVRYVIYMESRRYEADLSTRPRAVDRDPIISVY